MNRRTFLKHSAMTAAAAAWAGRLRGAGVESVTMKPNFVFFLVDDLGAIDTAPYGNTFYETPNVSRLAGQGALFSQAYSACAVCSPTRAAIMTGRYPARLRVTDWIPGNKAPARAKFKDPEWNKFLPPGEMTVAQRLRDAGYATGLVGKWHLGSETGCHPLDRGFDEFFGILGGGSQYWPKQKKNSSQDRRIVRGRDAVEESEYLTDAFGREAESFVERHKDKPFFLYLSPNTVHTPLQAPDQLVVKYREKLEKAGGTWNPTYAAMVESMDGCLGRVLDKLQSSGIADRTVVVFTSDNGGFLGATTNAPLRGGKGMPYEGGIRVPLVVFWPNTTKPGSVCDAPATSTDFFPTILEMAGLAAMPDKHCDGISLAPLLRGQKGAERESIYWHFPHYRSAETGPYGVVRKGDWKLIEHYDGGKVELYNLRDDGRETTDLSASEKARTDELKADLRGWLKRVGAQMPVPNQEIPGTEKRHG